MSRNRFVQPQVERLYLVDVHRRAHQKLVDQTDPKPTAKDIADSASRVKAAEADGDWIEVKRELNARESRRVYSRMVKNGAIASGEKAMLDPDQVGFAKIAEYLVGWSFVGSDGKPVPVSEDAVGNLDGETVREIVEAIDAHEEAVAAEKNKRGETPQPAISPSVA